MSHIHNYDGLLSSLRRAFGNWRESERQGRTHGGTAEDLSDGALCELMLDFTLAELGIKVERPISFDRGKITG